MSTRRLIVYILQFHGWTPSEARQTEYGAKKLARVREKLEKWRPIGMEFPKV